MKNRTQGSGLIGRIITALGKMLDFPKKDWRDAGDIYMRAVVTYPLSAWQSVGGFGHDCRDALHAAYDAAGLHFGMTEQQIIAFEHDSHTLSFQDYISTLKQFADHAGAFSISNEFLTADGYKISIQVEKVQKLKSRIHDFTISCFHDSMI